MSLIQGRGSLFGKPKKSSSSAPIPDSGRSVSKGQIIEVLCSGGDYGIEGLGSNPKDNIYLDNTPITANGLENFKGIEVYERRGTPYQLPLADFNSEVTSEVSVGVTVAFNNTVTRTFVNDNCAAARVRLSFVLNENQKDKDGNVTGTKASSINFKIYIREGTSNPFVERANITQSGKYSEAYEKIWFFNVNPIYDEYSIRIERVTPADTADFRRVLRWESYSVVIDSLLNFKRLAYLGIKFNAEDFGQSIPERRYKIKAQIMLIPTNATIALDKGLDYDGSAWDGNFKIPNKTCGDFLAIMWFYMTDTIDGCGIAPQNINRYSLYEVSKYNNELVPNGLGGVERRYLFEFVLNKQGSPYDNLNYICSGCNCRMIEEYGQITFIQDRPQEIFATLSNSDVDNGEFIYSTVDSTDIATQVQVTWTDQDSGKTRQEFLNDPKLISLFGKQSKQIEAVGCSRRSQAIRIGRGILYSEAKEIELVTFKARDFMMYCPCGAVIAIQDYNLLGVTLGGIIKASTNSSVTFDIPIELKRFNGFNEEFYLAAYPDVRETIKNGVFTSGYQHYVLYGNTEGRKPNGYLIYIQDIAFNTVTRIITSLPGNYTTLSFEAVNFIPIFESSFFIQSPDYLLKRFKIESKEYDDDSVNITAKQFDNFKWDYIERGFTLEATTTSTTQSISRPLAPTKLSANVMVNNGFTIECKWLTPLIQDGSTDNNITKYYLYYRVNTNSWQVLDTQLNTFTLRTNTPGLYEFRVVAENILNQQSDYSEIIGVTATTIQAFTAYNNSYTSSLLVES